MSIEVLREEIMILERRLSQLHQFGRLEEATLMLQDISTKKIWLNQLEMDMMQRELDVLLSEREELPKPKRRRRTKKE